MLWAKTASWPKPAPGKTRLIVYFRVENKLLLTDLPGFGHAGVSRQMRETYSKLVDSYLTCGRPITLVIHLIDIRHSPTPEDLQMLSWLNQKKIPCLILLAKADKLSRSQTLQRRAEIVRELPGEGSLDLMVFSSFSRQSVAPLKRVGFSDTAV